MAASTSATRTGSSSRCRPVDGLLLAWDVHAIVSHPGGAAREEVEALMEDYCLERFGSRGWEEIRASTRRSADGTEETTIRFSCLAGLCTGDTEPCIGGP